MMTLFFPSITCHWQEKMSIHQRYSEIVSGIVPRCELPETEMLHHHQLIIAVFSCREELLKWVLPVRVSYNSIWFAPRVGG